jgi:8-oxo-dGTP diphosphatase
MQVNNPLYKNQGIHVIATIFTVDRGIAKVLLIKRNNDPFKDMWALVGGALYNNETLEQGIIREIKEKIGLSIPNIAMFNTFSKVDRSPLMRMIAIGYIGIVDCSKVELIKKTIKTSDADWVPIDKVGKLAYDHNEIINNGIGVLKQKIVNTDILKSLYPDGFTLPEIQKTYEAILNKELDRRNFRKKLLSLGLIYDTGDTKKFEGTKPAKVYKFKDSKENKNVF